MWTKEKAMKLIYNTGLIPIIRVESADIAFKVADAFLDGDVNIIEVTMSVPGAVDVVKQLIEKYGDKVLIGTGTVLDVKMAEEVIKAGSEFIVSPNYSRDLIETAKKLEGIARHASTHAAGIVISREPLINHVPLQRSSKDNEHTTPTTQFAMDTVAKLGLLKLSEDLIIDILFQVCKYDFNTLTT